MVVATFYQLLVDETIRGVLRAEYFYHPQDPLETPGALAKWLVQVPGQLGDYFAHFNFQELIVRRAREGANIYLK